MARSYLLTSTFWAGAFERAVKTFAQTLGAALTVNAASSATGVSVFAAGAGGLWLAGLAVAATAAVFSILFSVGSGASGIGPSGSPALVDDRATDHTPGRHSL